MVRLCALLLLLAVLASGQVSPLWQASPYMEARNFIVVNNNQKLYGNYTITISFLGNFPLPELALAIPQLRIVNNASEVGFKCKHTGLTQTGFIHNLNVSSTSTQVWYLLMRYLVISTTYLLNDFQTALWDSTTTTINTGSGTRTETMTITSLSPVMNMSSTPVCVPWLTGVTTTTTDFYQLNLTCAITAANTATLTGVVHPNTKVSLLTVYVLIYDETYLAIASIYFIDYALTTTFYGVQKSFIYLPKGYFDNDYIGGLASFSMLNNYEFNSTLNNLNVTASSTSLYDSVPQLQIRLRICQAPYTYYNLADGLCYAVCPPNSYYNFTSLICYSCLSNCLTCLNSTTCTTCATNMYLSAGTCLCVNYTYLYNNSCYGCHYSCQTCTYTGQYYNCLTCDAAMHRTAAAYTNFNFTCYCDQYFYDVGVTLCADICGDGRAVTSQCDDGNTVSGDGCSSTCVKETNWTCVLDAAFLSSCYYVGNVSIVVDKVYKEEFGNDVYFYCNVTPWVTSMAWANSSLVFDTNASIDVSGSSYYYDSGYLVYKVRYTKDLAGTYIRVDLKPSVSGLYSQMPPANITFLVKTGNGYKLLYYSNQQYTTGQKFSVICTIFGAIVLASSLLFLFGRLKWVGNLLFFSLQFQFMVFILVEDFMPTLSALCRMKLVMGYNEVLGIERLRLPKYPSMYVERFSIWYDYDVNIMVALQLLGLLMYLIYFLTFRKVKNQCLRYGGDPERMYTRNISGKILNFFNFEFFIFWTFFNMVNQIVAMGLYVQGFQPEFIPIALLNAACIIAAVIPLFAKRKDVKSYTETLYYRERGREESLLSLGAFLVMFTLLGLGLAVSFIISYLIYAVPVGLIVYLGVRKPFCSKWVRAAYVVNNVCIILILLYVHLIKLADTKEFMPYLALVVMLFDWLFNIIVWAREVYIACRYGEQNLENAGQESVREKSSQKDEDIDFFRPSDIENGQNNSVLNSLIRNNNKNLKEGSATKRPLITNTPSEDVEMTARNNQHPYQPNQPNQGYQGYPPEQEFPNTPNSYDRKDRAKQPVPMKVFDESEDAEREEIQRKRQKWAKEIQEMKDIKELRERTRQNVDGESALKPRKSQIRSTKQKGLDPSRMKDIDSRGLVRYL